MNQKIDTASLVTNSAWLPQALDVQQRRIAFANIDRAGLVREAFLDDRMAGSVKAKAIAAIDDIAAGASRLSGQPLFIFHTAFCCSTLMARALDVPGQCLSLKEPDILMHLSNAYRTIQNETARQQADQMRDIIIKLLARPHEGAEKVLMKPTNTANNLAPIFAKMGFPMILLYGDLKGFLISVLKKGEACKAFVRKQYSIFAMDGVGVAGIPQRQALGLTDLQIAALVWRHQMELFTQLLQTPGANQIRSLDFRRLLDDPAHVLRAANTHFNLNIDAQMIDSVATGPVFKKNSKFDDQDYDAGARVKDETALLERHRNEIEMIEEWAMKLKLAVDVPSTMPAQLV